MVIDKVNGVNIPRYLVYDVIHFMGKSLKEHSFHPDRLDCIRKHVVGEIIKTSESKTKSL